ncbi:MAG: protein kinase [Candidatus Marinimicrobia bacterium]|nr:protein kinase [Candidatus Neomarinimicrobiota bacterium]
MIGKTISHYRILEKLGEGGMGIVYKAEDTKLKRTVALKFLPHHLLANEEDKTRFLHEGQAASALNHPNIMTIHEIDEVDDQSFITMEYIEGETLKDKLEKRPLKTKELLNIAIAVADGLNAAHEQKIVHRDIKSENIMISKTGLVKIMDFGIAKRKGVPSIGTTPGTLAYMSPEQAEGSEVDSRSDLFSFGVVMYEMATGQLPFKGEHDAAILYSIVNEVPLPVTSLNPNIPKELERFIHKALEKEVEDRYQHADDLAADLRKLKKDLESGRTTTITTQIPIMKEPEKKPLWRQPAFILAFVLAVVVMVIGVGLFLKRETEAPAAKTKENSLAVLYFENLKDPEDSERLGQILQELVITDLSEITSLKVFSRQRLFDIQKQLGSRDRRKIDPEIATEIAQKAGAQTMLTGNLIQTEDKMILTSQLIDVKDGTVIESQRVEGNDIYTMVDSLAVQIYKDLKIPSVEEDQVDVAVKEKTSSSLDAYQYYLAGVDLFNESRFEDAIIRFQNALSIDSTFGKAYYKMAIAQWWSQSQSGRATSEQAKESLSHILSGRWYTSTKDKLMAKGATALIGQNWDEAQEIYHQLVNFIPDEKEAWYGLGEAYFHGPQDFENAQVAFERVLEYDPEYTLAYRHIFDIYNSKGLFNRGIIRASQFVNLNPDSPWGYYYVGFMLKGKGDNTKALEAFQKAVALDSEFTSAYENIFDIYFNERFFNRGIEEAIKLTILHSDKSWTYSYLGAMYRGKGEFDLALRAYQKGLLLDTKAYSLTDNIGYTYQLMGRYDEAIQKFSELSNPDIPLNWQQNSKIFISSVYREQGQLRKALKITQERLIIAKSVGIDSEANAYINLAYTSHILGDTTAALAYLDSAFSLQPNINTILGLYWIKGLIRARWGQEQALTSIIDSVGKMIQEKNVMNQRKPVYNALMLHRFIIRGQVEDALQEFENLKATKEISDRYLYDQALLYLKKGGYEKALDITQEMQSPAIVRDAHSYIRDAHSYNYPRAFYLRGLIYEEMGEMDLARLNYERLLSLWRDGDEELFERQDTMKRLSRLIRIRG